MSLNILERTLSNALKTSREAFLHYKSYSDFKKRYQSYSPELFINKVGKDALAKYKERWRCYGVHVETDTFLLCNNLSGKIDLDIIPEYIFARIIERRLNPYPEINFFELKNVYGQWFSDSEIFPKCYFHKIDGHFYDPEFNLIDDISRYIKTSSIKYPVIIKPSKDTYGGNGVHRIEDEVTLMLYLDSFQHLVCQECIIQSEYLSNIYSRSINSVRSCVYRDIHGNCHVLCNSIRFGTNGGLDNVTSGGVVCDIHDGGSFNSYATDYHANKLYKHPNSGISFVELILPEFEQLNKVVIDILRKIPLCNLASLDMCLDENNKWRCLEVNLSGQTIYFRQYAGNGFFGEFTDEVIARTT